MLIHLGNVPVLVASSAKAAMEIMKFHDLSVSGRPRLMMPNILLYGCKEIAFSPYGEYWRQLKRIVVCHLLSNKQVKSFRKVRQEEIGVTISMLAESCGSTVDLGELIVSLANKITCRTALGRIYDHGSKFTKLLLRFMNMLGVFCVGDYIPWLSWVDGLKMLEGNAKKIATEFDDFFDFVLKEHRSTKSTEENAKSDEDRDLVDILLDVQGNETTGFTLGDDTFKGVILMFSAGTDTTFTTLEWTLGELIKHPPAMKKLQQEATIIAEGRSMILVEDLEKMQYLKVVVKESMRLHTPIPLIPRETTEDVKLMGYDIPVGTQVLVNVWAIGRDPTVWEDSNKFRPERFLKDNSTDYKSLHYDWLPFGVGRRGCPETMP
ncbi:hypothetical protein Lser_V15G19755 [Lactuca serriola]